MEKVILIKYGELTTKKGNRNFFVKTLTKNIENKLKDFNILVEKDLSRMYIHYNELDEENIINKIGTFSSKISSDYIIDLIYSLLFKKNYQELLIKKVSMNLDWDERRNESIHEKGKGE